MKETLSLVKMDATPVPALLDKLLVLITPVDAIMKVTHTMKEILSLPMIHVTLVLALLDK